MESGRRLKTKFSFSPSVHKENVYKVRAKVGKKTTRFPNIEIRETLFQRSKSISTTPRKHRLTPNKLFKGVHQIGQAETYLPNDKASKSNKTNGSSSPRSSDKGMFRSSALLVEGKETLSTSSLSRGEEGNKNLLQRTVSIKIDGKTEPVSSKEQLVDALTKLIMGGSEVPSQQEDVEIEFFGESSIHGEEENFIEMDSLFLTDGAQSAPEDQHLS